MTTITFNAKLLAAVSLAQSNEETRYYLCGVFFDGNTVVATDGHMMTYATDEDHTNPSGDDADIYPISKRTTIVLKGKRAHTVKIEGGILSVLSDTAEVLHLEPCEIIEATYPDWKRVCPKEASNSCNAAFNHTILKRLCDTAAILDRQECALTITGADGGAPHCVAYDGFPAIKSVIMPMRISS